MIRHQPAASDVKFYLPAVVGRNNDEDVDSADEHVLGTFSIGLWHYDTKMSCIPGIQNNNCLNVIVPSLYLCTVNGFKGKYTIILFMT